MSDFLPSDHVKQDNFFNYESEISFIKTRNRLSKIIIVKNESNDDDWYFVVFTENGLSVKKMDTLNDFLEDEDE